MELDLCLGDAYIEPRLRAEAITAYEAVYAEDWIARSHGRCCGRRGFRNGKRCDERWPSHPHTRNGKRRHVLCVGPQVDGLDHVRCVPGARLRQSLLDPLVLGHQQVEVVRVTHLVPLRLRIDRSQDSLHTSSVGS